ncbi:YD repeat protein [Catenulispora acidiphila DSM 44928]|uniref:YD repeat protein n=1 Tax=Catenulispora acidiphila (strain DSM 44928 / JCM 14897 / NBRC 102108 / NRRL B-24433 / ID139908) TaxID=479433 RepID=C7Q0A7_CATAD|nr:DUF6531 domain-containing protein [Catenulispora acidiphila]ACU77440.1 YD repeat protein [Catenulispora acidiphila DSM 44928]
MARPSGWDILGLDGDPTPGVVESVQALAKEFGDFAHDVEAAYRSLNSFGSDTAALEWVGQTAEAFKGKYGPLPGRLQKLYTSYSEASDALSAYWPLLQAAQTKADTALRQAQDAHADLQRATTSATNAATDLKTAQQNHAATPNPQAVTDAQTAHDTAQTNLNNAKAQMAALTEQANDAYNDRINAAKTCGSALHHAQSDGIHNKSWWQHVGEDLSTWGGEIGKIAGELAPVLDIIALATSWIPGVDVVTAALAEADNIVALAGTAMATIGDAMQGHWGDALLGAGMLALTFVGARAFGSEAEAVEGEAGGLEGEAGALEGEEGAAARTAEGNEPANIADDPVDVVSGWMLTDACDLELPGVLPVVLRRAYASGYTTGRLFGPGWSSTLDQRLSINEAGIHFAGDDAQRLDYSIPNGDEELLPERGSRWPLIWDRELDEIRITDPWSGQTRHFSTVHFNSELGQIRDLTAISDRNGNRITVLRDEHGTPTGLEHPAYRVAVDTIASAAGPRVSGLRLLGARETGSDMVMKRFSYDGQGRLTGVINSSDVPFSYEWNDTDRISAWTDQAGYRYGYHYDAIGRVVRGQGQFLAGSFTYDPAHRTTVHTNSLGHVTTFVYDENGHVCSETDALGHTTLTETDRYGMILSRTDALGTRTTLVRDEAGNVRRLVATDGATAELEYNHLHQVVAATGRGGATWRRAHDDRGNLVSATDPAGGVTEFEYTAEGVLAATTDPLGAVTRFTTDAAGLPVTVLDAVGSLTRVERDFAGRVVRLTDPMGAVTAFEWNAEGLPVSRTLPDGARTTWRHDDGGRLLEVVDAIGATTRFEPGPMETLTARTGPDGVRHNFTYDSELKLVAVTNPHGAAWTYTYDAAGRLTGESDFIGRRLGYEYDVAGRLCARITGTGQRLTLDRDATGRIVARHTPEGDYGYTYDSAGRLVVATGPNSELSYEYDTLGRLLATTTDDRTMRYSYDLAGRLIRRTTASGVESTWTYDSAGRAVGLDTGGDRLEFGFDASGREIERLIGSEVWLTRSYDVVGRPIAQSVGRGRRHHDQAAQTDLIIAGSRTGKAVQEVLQRSWVWRQDGVPEEIRDSLRGTSRIASDAAGRVTAISAHSWSESYAYDAFGNLTVQDDAAGPLNLPATAAGEGAGFATRTLIRRSARARYEHDQAGRLTRSVRRTLDGRSKVTQYVWDSEDRLVHVITPENGTWHYSYDPLGRRTAKTRFADDGTVVDRVTFLWDGPRLAEQSVQGPESFTVTLTWDYDPGTFRPATQRRRNRLGDADQTVIDEAFHAIVADLVGSPTELVTPDGRVVWHTTTSLWGRTIGTSAESGVDCPLRFPGQYHDDESGLHYNLNRYYDSETAAYLTPDPLGLVPAPNDHAYVPNPLTVSDPLGLSYEGPNGQTMYPNNMPGTLDTELAQADRLGVVVSSPGTSEFDSAIASGTVKWAVKDDGSIVVMPKFVNGQEISHSVLTRGASVQAAGEAEIAGSGADGYFGLDINDHSGHFFEPGWNVASIGKDAFSGAGVLFP